MDILEEVFAFQAESCAEYDRGKNEVEEEVAVKDNVASSEVFNEASNN
jgi:hypothetical protein